MAFRSLLPLRQPARVVGAQVSRDVLQRWTFPFTPDTNLLRLPASAEWADSSTYSMSRNNIYRSGAPIWTLWPHAPSLDVSIMK